LVGPPRVSRTQIEHFNPEMPSGFATVGSEASLASGKGMHNGFQPSIKGMKILFIVGDEHPSGRVT